MCCLFLPLIKLHTQQHQSKRLLWLQTRYWGQMSLIWMPSPRATDQHHNQVNHSHRRTSSQRKTDSPKEQKHRKQTEYQSLEEFIKTLVPANWTEQGIDPDVSSAAWGQKGQWTKQPLISISAFINVDVNETGYISWSCRAHEQISSHVDVTLCSRGPKSSQMEWLAKLTGSLRVLAAPEEIRVTEKEPDVLPKKIL